MWMIVAILYPHFPSPPPHCDVRTGKNRCSTNVTTPRRWHQTLTKMYQPMQVVRLFKNQRNMFGYATHVWVGMEARGLGGFGCNQTRTWKQRLWFRWRSWYRRHVWLFPVNKIPARRPAMWRRLCDAHGASSMGTRRAGSGECSNGIPPTPNAIWQKPYM